MDALGLVGYNRRDAIYEGTMNSCDATWAEPLEADLVTAVGSAAHENEVTPDEGRRHDVRGGVVLGDGFLTADGDESLEFLVHIMEGGLRSSILTICAARACSTVLKLAWLM